MYGVVLSEEIRFDAETAMNRLMEKGIGTRPFFWPLHEQPVLRRMGFFEKQSFPVAEKLARRGFYLPSGLGLENHQIQDVVRIVKEKLR